MLFLHELTAFSITHNQSYQIVVIKKTITSDNCENKCGTGYGLRILRSATLTKFLQ